MKNLKWLAFLLPLNAFANPFTVEFCLEKPDDDICIGLNVDRDRLDTLEAEQVVQDDRLDVVEGEQEVQNDRLDDLEAIGTPNPNIITEGSPTFNTGVGVGAFVSNTTGNFNTASGTNALLRNTTGHRNTASGAGALQNNSTGAFNTGSGTNTLALNTTGRENTAIGFQALPNNTTGSGNTASGTNALHFNTTGFGNTAGGGTALHNNTTGNFNIAIGLRAGINATTGSSNIYIDHEGFAAEANTIRIGNAADHFLAFIAGTPFPLVSSKRFKKDIHDMSEASANLMRLRPVTFRYRKEYDGGDHRLQYGLIAEEVAEVYPELVVHDDTGRVRTVLYQELNVMLLNELQKQHRQIQDLTERLARLEQTLTAQQLLAALGK